MIAGTAYADSGTTPLASNSLNGIGTVASLVNGQAGNSATLGANGYYYLMEPAGALSGLNQVLTYLEAGYKANINMAVEHIASNDYFQYASGNQLNASLYGNTLQINSGGATTSTMFSGLSTALGSNSGNDFLFSGGSITSGTNVGISATRTYGLTIDQDINTGTGGSFALNASGTVTMSANVVTGAASIQTAGSILQGVPTKSIQASSVSLISVGEIGHSGTPVIISGGSGTVSLSLNSGGNSNATISSLTTSRSTIPASIQAAAALRSPPRDRALPMATSSSTRRSP